MRTKEAVVMLRGAGVKNSEIAKLLNISKQYVSHVCRTSQVEKKQAKLSAGDGLVSIGVASRLVGVHAATIRRWSDEGKIAAVRISGGRGDRRFMLSDLWQLRRWMEADKVWASK